ncbi:hypothetical protein Amet_0176 [Alkaliphilus metalliredigens QYMF]|uniref:Spo0E like sporulation regulatory protein n=1 Tax=Alkaliphilus metalliredigens (strain QYMF) TaxID=293826 RepID=A6TJP5_ALKMQ|nr:hypothetical protein [Alkaliphilus metalliredigens]ABR46413.1 hypothetical protein Amet_0176 [Alkaliphilus metalliredigens QYMF]
MAFYNEVAELKKRVKELASQVEEGKAEEQLKKVQAHSQEVDQILKEYMMKNKANG